MSDDHETETMREAKAYVATSAGSQSEEKSFEASIKTWESSVNWDRVLQGPKIDVRAPFIALTALAGRIKDDCVLDFPSYAEQVKKDPDGDLTQSRLQQIKALALRVNDAIGVTDKSIIDLTDKIHKEKTVVAERYSLVAKALETLNPLIEKLATEATSRGTALTKLATDLEQTAKDIESKKAIKTAKDKEKTKENANYNDWTRRFDIIGNALFKREEAHNQALRSIKSAYDSADKLLKTYEGNEKTQKTQKATYAKLLADLHTAKTQLVTRQSMLGVALKSLHASQTQLTNTAARWSTLAGNAGKLATSLKEVTEDVEDSYIPTRKWVAEDVVAAVNVGSVFLQFEGVEKELRATLDTIDGAMSGVSKNEGDKVTEIVAKVRARVDQIVKVEIPAHGAQLQWFPVPVDLGAQEDAEVYNIPGVEFDDSDDEGM